MQADMQTNLVEFTNLFAAFKHTYCKYAYKYYCNLL